MLKDVIILGCGATHIDCQYHCETWGVNGTYGFAKRLDKLFMTDEESEVNSSWYDLPKLRKSNTILVLPEAYPKLAKSGLPIEIFPMDKVFEKFPTRFYSNSIAYMIAYALLHTKSVQGPDDLRPKVIDGYNRIWFYGIDMLTHGTYMQEKGGVEYWMGAALGMGVKILNTKGSATGKTWNGRMYGYWGLKAEELAKERLMAPWEIIRVSKGTDPETEWIKEGTEYKPIRTQVRAGEEVVV